MSYESWRISYQSSEQAARAAYSQVESQARKIEELKDIIQRPDRKELQVEGKHPAPCAKFCEATAFGIDERRMKHEIKELRAALVGAVDALEHHQEQTRPIAKTIEALTRCKEVLSCS